MEKLWNWKILNRNFTLSQLSKIERLTILFALLALPLSLVFIFGYIIGRADGVTSLDPSTAPTTVTLTPISVKVDFEITPMAPDESNWISYTLEAHYHEYTLKIPAEFNQTKSDAGQYVFQDDKGDILIINASDTYTKQNPRYIIDGSFGESYSSTTVKGIISEKASIDLTSENISAKFTHTLSSVDGFLFRDILNSITVKAEAPDFQIPYKTYSNNNISVTYPGSYLIDVLNANGINCNNEPESKINFALYNSTPIINMDINSCNTRNSIVTDVKPIDINNMKVDLVTYEDGSTCMINPQSNNLTILKSMPIANWRFAPKTTEYKGKNVQICLTKALSIYPSKGQDELISQFIKIVESLTF